jgi:hypothetical protein
MSVGGVGMYGGDAGAGDSGVEGTRVPRRAAGVPWNGTDKMVLAVGRHSGPWAGAKTAGRGRAGDGPGSCGVHAFGLS